MRLAGRRAIVTGGASGIGRGIAERLASEGADVTILDISRQNLDSTLRDVPHLHGLLADVSRRADVEDAVAAARDRMGGVDILVNNAGIAIRYAAIDFSEEDWDRVIGVNLKGTFLMSQAVARVMRDSGRGGAIVNLSSTSAEVVRSGHVAYGTSKGGIRQLTKVLAVEWGEYNIRVNAVGPGGILTPVTAPTVAERGEEWFMGKMARGRMGVPADVASAVAFLVSDDADFITGTTLYVEGGVLAVDPRDPVRHAPRRD